MSLQKIQSALKVPKGQYNDFGKFKYRSCEDILEALKPLLTEQEYALIITDEVVEIGGRVYVKAKAFLTSKDNKPVGEAIGYAREPLAKKGMDESMITGSASSYARKYALNGLFAIDDTKDADATHNGQNGNPTENSEKTITPRQHFQNAQLNDQVEEIQKLIRETGYERENSTPLDTYTDKQRLAIYDKLIKSKKEKK